MRIGPAFAAFFAVLWGGHNLTAPMRAGAMTLIAMLVVELAADRRVEAEVSRIAV